MPDDNFICPGCGAQVSVFACSGGHITITFTLATSIKTGKEAVTLAEEAGSEGHVRPNRVSKGVDA